MITFRQYDYFSIPVFKIETLKQHLNLKPSTDTKITSTQITELALYDVTESCPVQFLSHSSVVSLVNLHVNIKTLLCWTTLLANCAFRLQYIVEHVEHTNYTTVWGEPKLNIHYVGYYRTRASLKMSVWVCLHECCCHLLQTPIKNFSKNKISLSSVGPGLQPLEARALMRPCLSQRQMFSSTRFKVYGLHNSETWV